MRLIPTSLSRTWKRLPRLVRWPILLMAGGAWALVVGELFLRVLNPVPVVPRHVIAMPYGIRGNAPSREYVHRSADFRIEIRTNSRGIRSDEEFTYEKPEGVKRIVALGDSFGMGYEVDLEDMFLSVMERELEAAGEEVQVINLSVSGHGTAEELIALREEGLKYDPDLVLVAFHHTDYEENVRSNLFRLTDSGELERAAKTYLPGVEVRKKLERIPGFDLVSGNSMLFWFMREWVSYNVAKPLLTVLRGRGEVSEDTETEAEAETPPAAESEMSEMSEESEESGAASRFEPVTYSSLYAVELTAALLDEIEQTANEVGARVLVFTIPVRLDREHFKSMYVPENLRPPMEATIVDPVETFEAHSGPLIYWERSQRHLTPYGCRLAGELLARTIRDENLLEPVATERQPL